MQVVSFVSYAVNSNAATYQCTRLFYLVENTILLSVYDVVLYPVLQRDGDNDFRVVSIDLRVHSAQHSNVMHNTTSYVTVQCLSLQVRLLLIRLIGRIDMHLT